MMRSKFKKALLVGAALVAMVGVASAAQVTHTASVPLTVTNWGPTNLLPMVPQFDDMGGTRILTSVSWTAKGTVEGDAKAESLDNSATNINLTLQADIELTGIPGVPSVMLSPADARNFAASAFDGTIDFGGTSGASFFNIGGMVSQSDTDLAPVDPGWIGLGFLPLVGTADASSTGTGSGNLITQFATNAALEFEVTYRWDERIIPEPATMLLLGTGLLGTAFGARRRMKK